MSTHESVRRAWWRLAVVAIAVGSVVHAETAGPLPIDLATALRLAGAQNLDVSIARERLAQARAARLGALQRFLPWLTAGASYKRHEGRAQTIEGAIIDADKQLYNAGGAVSAEVDIGHAYFATLAARQTVVAAQHGAEAVRQDVVLAAAHGYFDLAAAQAQMLVARRALAVAEEYLDQLKRAVTIGIAFKGDELLVQVRAERRRVALRRAEEARRIAAARLAETLHLDPTVDLAARDEDFGTLTLPGTDADEDALVREALTLRPERRQSQALVAAARHDSAGATYGPLIPTLGAQVAAAELGGGIDTDFGHRGGAYDYFAGLSWRIGPGGLFDVARIRAADARLNEARIVEQRIEDRIRREVVVARTRIRSLSDQLATVQRQVSAAERGWNLARERRAFGVESVLETVEAEEELASAQRDYVAAVADYDKAQYALVAALGKLSAPVGEDAKPPDVYGSRQRQPR